MIHLRLVKPLFNGIFLIVLILCCGCNSNFSSKTQDDRYKVKITPIPNPVPLNKLFQLKVEVESNIHSGNENEFKILVDAGMPDHNHGMNIVPKVISGELPGEYLVSGMLFHMPGTWMIKVQINDGETVSEAQFLVIV